MPAASPLLAANPEFVAIEMPAPAKTTASTAARHADASPSADPVIHVELRRGPLHLSVRWPSSAANDCTAWLRADHGPAQVIRIDPLWLCTGSA